MMTKISIPAELKRRWGKNYWYGKKLFTPGDIERERKILKEGLGNDPDPFKGLVELMYDDQGNVVGQKTYFGKRRHRNDHS